MIAAISYLTIIGWLIAFFIGREKADGLLKFHLSQSLGLSLTWIVFTLIAPIGGIYRLGGILYLIIVVFAVIGIGNALNERKKPLPFVGEWFEKNLNVLK